MQSPLDKAITDAAGAESTYVADTVSVSNIKAAIDAATSPLAPAMAQLAADASAFNAALDALAAAAVAAKV